jgi:hypothetical protein
MQGLIVEITCMCRFNREWALKSTSWLSSSGIRVIFGRVISTKSETKLNGQILNTFQILIYEFDMRVNCLQNMDNVHHKKWVTYFQVKYFWRYLSQINFLRCLNNLISKIVKNKTHNLRNWILLRGILEAACVVCVR